MRCNDIKVHSCKLLWKNKLPLLYFSKLRQLEISVLFGIISLLVHNYSFLENVIGCTKQARKKKLNILLLLGKKEPDRQYGWG